MSESAVQVRGLRVERGGALVLDGLSVSVVRGLVTGLLGPSGSGKSTLLRSIVGVQRVAAGTITVLASAPGRPASDGGSATSRRRRRSTRI